MPRKAKNPSYLTIWRENQGIKTGEFVKKTGLPQSSVYRIERGQEIGRTLATRYLSYWGGDLNNLGMFPKGLKIIDLGWGVKISFIPSTE